MSDVITKEDFLSRYGQLPLVFTSYYKYTFTYCATASDGVVVSADYGGNAEQIYRHEVTPEATIKLTDNEHYACSAHQNGQQIFYEYDY